MTRAALVAVIVLTAGGSAVDQISPAQPDPPPTRWTANQLADRYAESRRQLTVAAAKARRSGDTERAGHLTALARPDRQFIRVSPAGDGQAAGGHSDYFVPGSVALQAIADIVRGRAT